MAFSTYRSSSHGLVAPERLQCLQLVVYLCHICLHPVILRASQEFKSTQGWLGYQLKERVLEQIFRDADFDDRGTLEYPEFVEAMKAVREVEMKEIQKVFEEQDQDRNGLLSPTELEGALKVLNYDCDLQVVLEVTAQVQDAKGGPKRLELNLRGCAGLPAEIPKLRGLESGRAPGPRAGVPQIRERCWFRPFPRRPQGP